MTYTDLRKHWADSADKELSARAEKSHRNMGEIHALTTEMRNDGWKDICYCPKDGSVFWAWSPVMPNPYRCKYDGEWPNGKWWALMDGDIWPDQPVLFKPDQESK